MCILNFYVVMYTLNVERFARLNFHSFYGFQECYESFLQI